MTPRLSLRQTWHRCLCFSSISGLTNKQFYYFKVSPYRVSPCQWNSLWIYRHRFLNPPLKLQIPSDEIRSSVVFFIAVTSENQLWDTFNVFLFLPVYFPSWRWKLVLFTVHQKPKGFTSSLSFSWHVVHRDEQIIVRIKHWVKWSGFKICIS